MYRFYTVFRLKLSVGLAGLFLFASAPIMAQGVVSAADPRAAEAGREMLDAGGSATDAALATMIALTVVEPQSSGIGGGGFFIHHEAERGLIETIDGRERAPSSATPERFLDSSGEPMAFDDAFRSGLSVGVPGNIRLMEKAHARWGRLPWDKLFEPAIRLADQGFEVTPRFAQTIANWASGWKDSPAIAALYAPGGIPLQSGNIVRNPELAALLRQISAKGADAFYSGENAQKISRTVSDSTRNPATLTPQDLLQYTATPRPSVCGQYRQYRVCGMGPPSSGASTVLAMLGMLERFDLPELGKDSPVSWHLIADAMRLAYADRAIYTGDADFAPVPIAGLIDPRYLRTRSGLINPAKALGTVAAGTPPGSERAGAPTPSTEAGTTHFSVVDKDGNLVAMTSTVEEVFGSQLVANGMVLNNELTDFSFVPSRNGRPVMNRVQANKRPRSSMSPTIVYDESGNPILALGSAGGPRIIMHVLKTVVGVLDFNLTAKEAIALPNIFFDDDVIQLEESTYTIRLAKQLEAMGHQVRIMPLTSKVNAIQKIGDAWVGAADPRSDGVALYSDTRRAGLATAWAKFDRNGILASGADGVADRRTEREITIDDPVRIASISKLVVVLGVMRLVEDDKLNLDRDVSEILGWKLRNPRFPETPITLRMLLSHTSSLMDDGINYVVPLGTPLQSVAGAPEVFDAGHAPGTFFRYSNLNFPVVATLMERVTGERFDRLMQRLVLTPLDLKACFNWSTCSNGSIAKAVVLYDTDGTVEIDDLQGSKPVCPVRVAKGHSCDLENYVVGTNGAIFSPQGGLRITVRDLATVGMLLLKSGRHNGRQFLRPETLQGMQRPVWRYDGTNGQTDDGFYCSYGLATQILPTLQEGCADNLSPGENFTGHAGDAYGLRSGLWVDIEKGSGIAYFGINNGDNPPKGKSAYRAIEETLAAKHN